MRDDGDCDAVLRTRMPGTSKRAASPIATSSSSTILRRRWPSMTIFLGGGIAALLGCSSSLSFFNAGGYLLVFILRTEARFPPDRFCVARKNECVCCQRDYPVRMMIIL